MVERWAFLVALLFLGLTLHRLGASDIIGDDEAREVGIVQDVVAGHVLWPRFNDAVLPDKPILSHWVAGVAVATGGFSETNVRLAAALAAAAVVAWIVVLGHVLWDLPSGVTAGILLATMPTWFNHARVARPDTLLVLCLSAALGLAFSWWRSGHARDATTALLFVGLATAAKGPVGLGLFVIAFGSFLFWERSLGRLRQFLTLPGVIAFVVVGLGWYAIALGGWGEVFVREHLVGRYVRNLTGGLAQGHEYSRRPLLYHLLFYPTHLLAVAMPWTPFAGLAFWQIWRRGGFHDSRVRFLVCWMLAPVIAFTPAEWKLRYYLLPSLPAVALLIAPSLVDLFRARALEPQSASFKRTAIGSFLAVVLATAATGATSWILHHPERLAESDRDVLADAARLLGGNAQMERLAGSIVGVATAIVTMRSWPTLVACTAAASMFWMGTIAPVIEHSRSQRESFKPFALAVATRVPAPHPLAFWGDVVRPVVVYLQRPVPSLERDRTRLVPGQALLLPVPAWERLHQEGLVGDVLERQRGRLANLEIGELILTKATAPQLVPGEQHPAAERQANRHDDATHQRRR